MIVAEELWFEQVPVHGLRRRHEAMAKHCSWRTGGEVLRYFEPLDHEDLSVFLQAMPPDEVLLWLGLGSNLLVRDGGIAGTAINTTPGLRGLERLAGHGIRAEAGVPCPKVARFAAHANLVGGEFLAGIPGSIGGALAMNAGAFGGEIWNLVEGVVTVDRGGHYHQRARADFSVAYRSVSAPSEEWFVATTLCLQEGSGEAAFAQIKTLLAERARSQPTGQASCGSVFKNPPGDFAGRLIEAAGLKGQRVGGCHVSQQHANFIINDRDACAGDIETLIDQIRTTVARRFGLELELEVRIVGEVSRQ